MRTTVVLLSALASVAFLVDVSRAAEGFGETFAKPIEAEEIRIEYGALTYFNVDVDRQDTKLHMVRHDFGLSVPVWSDESNALDFEASVSSMDVDTGARLGMNWSDTRDPFPHNPLWDVRLGVSYRHRLENNWSAGFRLGIGSESDRPFSSLSEMVGDFTGYLRVPQDDTTAWLFMLNYASNRSFLPHVPIPGVAWQYTPDRKFRTLLGVPVSSVYWEPIEGLSLEGSYFIPRTVNAKIGYRIAEPLKIYAGFDWTNDRWLRHDRDDCDDRLFYYEKRVGGGVRWDIIENMWVDFSAGYAFDRFFFEGENYDDRHDNRISIDDSPYLRLQLEARL